MLMMTLLSKKESKEEPLDQLQREKFHLDRLRVKK